MDIITDFLERVWGKEYGIVRLASMKGEYFWPQNFSWPADQNRIRAWINSAMGAKKEIVFYPDIFSMDALVDNSGTRDKVEKSKAMFLDFDKHAPQNDAWYTEHNLPLPTFTIRTSTSDHMHVYWILNEFLPAAEAERLRRTLVYIAGSDPTGWDLGQAMRLPGSINYKYKKGGNAEFPVYIDSDSGETHDVGSLPPASKDFKPLVRDYIKFKDRLPHKDEVLAKHEFTDDFIVTFLSDVRRGKRSDTLMYLSYCMAEAGLSEPEMYVLLVDADSRWGKYKDRLDADIRYAGLIDSAKAKHPHGLVQNVLVDKEENKQIFYTLGELINCSENLEWMFEGFLEFEGSALFNGQPGVGKTQLGIRLAVAAALGKDFLIWKNVAPRPLKTLFYSLEMSLVALKFFVEKMSDLYVEETFQQLSNNLIFAPINDYIDLDTMSAKGQVSAQQMAFIKQIEEIKPDIVIIDSLWMAAGSSLANDETVRRLSQFLRYIRRNYNCAIIAIHHPRKSSDSKGTGGQDDIYGSRMIGAEAHTLVSFVPLDNIGVEIGVYVAKTRLGKPIPPFKIGRTEVFDFQVLGALTQKDSLENLKKMFYEKDTDD